MKFDPVKIFMYTSVSPTPSEVGQIEVNSKTNVASFQLDMADLLEELAVEFRRQANETSDD